MEITAAYSKNRNWLLWIIEWVCRKKSPVLVLILLGAALANAHVCLSRNITFCGERIPVEDNFVAQKLMSVISKQIPTVNMVQLRQKKTDYFPIIEDYLRRFGLPQDFKYLPIVESGFSNVSSPVGARGFWQLMPPTARQYGLKISEDGYAYDERDDIYKSTEAACRKLVDDYNEIVRRFNMSSWVLTAAGYNWGNGNIQNKMRKEGANYFSMNLNPETAVYVYKIIAVKELFEYPELYLKSLGGNVFNVTASVAPPKRKKEVEVNTKPEVEDAIFETMTVEVNTEPKKPGETKLDDGRSGNTKQNFILAKLVGKYERFRDGDVVAIQLKANLETPYGFAAAGQIIKGTGWLIDGRVYVGFEEYGHSILVDNSNDKGLEPRQLKKDKFVTVRYEEDIE